MNCRPDTRSIQAGCLGAALGGTIALCLLLQVGGDTLKVLIVSVLLSSSLGAILSVALSDPRRLEPSRFSFAGIVLLSIPLSLLLIFPVVALHALLFDIPMPMADVKPSCLRRVIGSPIVLAFFFARVGWHFPTAIACVGMVASCVAYIISHRCAFSMMLAITAHVLLLVWLLYWVDLLPA